MNTNLNENLCRKERKYKKNYFSILKLMLDDVHLLNQNKGKKFLKL